MTVALSGEGADELFGGYLTYLADRLVRPFRAGAGAAAARDARRAGALPAGVGREDQPGIQAEAVDRRKLAAIRTRRIFSGTARFRNEQRQQIRPGANGNGLRELVDAVCDCGRSGVLDRYLAVDQNYYLPDDILYKADRMSMAHSLEVRPPFLDHADCGIRGSPAAAAQDPRHAAEIRAARN